MTISTVSVFLQAYNLWSVFSLQVAALILENTFTSILDMAGVLLPFLKWFIGGSGSKGPKILNCLVRSPWSTVDIVGEVRLHSFNPTKECITMLGSGASSVNRIHFLICRTQCSKLCIILTQHSFISLPFYGAFAKTH